MADEYEITPAFARDWDRIRRKVDGIEFNGMGGTNTRERIVIGPAPKPPKPPQAPVVPVGVQFTVNLTQTGGGNGTKTTAATWTYTAKMLGNHTTLGTSLSPQKTRPNGTQSAATLGTGYYDNSGVFKLYEALETPGTGACA